MCVLKNWVALLIKAGWYCQGKVTENQIFFKVKENSKKFVSGQGISKSLNPCLKSVKCQGILSPGCCKLFYCIFHIIQNNFVLKVTFKASLFLLINDLGHRKLLYSQEKKCRMFLPFGGNPEERINGRVQIMFTEIM